MKKLKENIQFLPPIQIILTYLVYMYPKTDWVLVGNLFGYSIFTSLVYVVFFCLSSFKGRFCFLTKASSISLLLISIFNSFSYCFVDYSTYEAVFSKSMALLTYLITFIYLLLKCLRNYSQKYNII
jgi:hypothetical protein